ncbi:hypothetical protein EDB89DRAFT_2078554 [Lactarius sanguifluus]|nr:hypothetical protein EDB89DRAFT_2078554 [Lactarius sanguifluus]
MPSLPAPTVSIPLLSPPPSPSPILAPDNMPERPLTPQLAFRSVPIVGYDADSISDNPVPELETVPDLTPTGFIFNNPDSCLFYPIYVTNPAYEDRSQPRTILAKWIKYDLDYTYVHGTLGRDSTLRSVPVHVGRRACNYGLMTEAKWKKLLRGADEEFAINEALMEIGDPRLTGEVNQLCGQSAVKDTLEGLLRDAHHRVTEITCQLVDVECEVTGSRIHLEMADAYEEINNQFLRTFNCPSLRSPELAPLPITNRRRPVEFPVCHDEERTCCIRCFGCKTYGHHVQDCVKRKKNYWHKEKCTPSPHVSSTVDHEERNDNKMTLLEHIALLDWEDWTLEVCTCCGKINAKHTELECPLYEQCQRCHGTGAYGFIRNHTCTPAKEEEDTSMNMVNEADFDLYWGTQDD